MVDAALGEAAAHGQACLAGADDEGVGVAHRTRSLLRLRSGVADRRVAGRLGGAAGDPGDQPVSTSTATAMPLVSTSNTAERARDCSTIGAQLLGRASPAIVKLTRICS